MATYHLFNIKEENKAMVLTQEQDVAFYRMAAQLLFVSERARRDIQTDVVFLTPHVNKIDEYYQGKLKTLLKYLKGKINMKLKVTVNYMYILKK